MRDNRFLMLWLAGWVFWFVLFMLVWMTYPVYGQEQAVLVLDAPPRGTVDWILHVKVGETDFAVPRVELRKLVVQHPEWRAK